MKAAPWLALFLAWSASAHGAVGAVKATDPGAAPPGWVEVAPPATEAEWHCANHANSEHSVSGDEDAPLLISGFEEEQRGDLVLELADGRLIASNHGEWGGKIEWLPKGASERRLVANANSVGILARGDEVFIAAGLAHLGGDTGKLLRLRRSAEGWTSTEVLDLGTAPYATQRIDEDSLMIADGEGLSLVDLSRLTVKRLHGNTGWGYLYPNSLRPFRDAIAIGARGAVILLRPEGSGYRERWWVPAKCGRPSEACPCSMMKR